MLQYKTLNIFHISQTKEVILTAKLQELVSNKDIC